MSLTPRLSAFPGWGGIFGQNFKTPGGFPLKVPINIQLPGLPCAAQQLRQQRISHAFVVGVEHLALRVVALQPLPRALQLLRVLPEPQFATRSGERDGSDPPPPGLYGKAWCGGRPPPMHDSTMQIKIPSASLVPKESCGLKPGAPRNMGKPGVGRGSDPPPTEGVQDSRAALTSPMVAHTPHPESPPEC